MIYKAIHVLAVVVLLCVTIVMNFIVGSDYMQYKKFNWMKVEIVGTGIIDVLIIFYFVYFTLSILGQ